ncbi:uncharacterized protein [Littorina saxatilis]|uniref:uncharacterized protein n=1 Tax=Littorina saxatilis TaxID=31220 RepID=UPI0038B642F9
MEHVMFVALLCYSYCRVITAGTDGQFAGYVNIESCKDTFITIREKANNTILCTGFNKRDTIVWTFKGAGSKISPVATCNSSVCTVHDPSHFAVERSESESTLYYQQYDREVDKDAIVTCHSQFGGSNRSMPCNVIVIKPAELSSCAVEEDRDRGTVRGSCRFEHAYSDRRAFLCTWFWETERKSKLLSGNIQYDNGTQGPSGVCTFTNNIAWKPGTYTYIINFYPGPGNITVNVGNIDTSPETKEENDLPLGAIAGGIVAVVAVIIIIVVVVVVVFIRRKRKQKPAGSARGSGGYASNENDDFEEHVNPMYTTSVDTHDTHSTDHKPSATAVRISPNSHNGHPAAPYSLEADMYTTVDGEARFVPNNQASGMGDRSGGYEDIGFDSNRNKRVPQKDEYAVVDKSRAMKGPASSANTNASSPAHTTECSDVYAVVDKSSSRNKAAKNIKVAEAETEGAAYAQVQKPKPALKPKTSTKPSSDKDVTQRGAEDDDEYHTLSHTRGSPHTQDQADLEPQYSHIGHD